MNESYHDTPIAHRSTVHSTLRALTVLFSQGTHCTLLSGHSLYSQGTHCATMIDLQQKIVPISAEILIIMSFPVRGGGKEESIQLHRADNYAEFVDGLAFFWKLVMMKSTAIK